MTKKPTKTTPKKRSIPTPKGPRATPVSNLSVDALEDALARAKGAGVVDGAISGVDELPTNPLVARLLKLPFVKAHIELLKKANPGVKIDVEGEVTNQLIDEIEAQGIPEDELLNIRRDALLEKKLAPVFEQFESADETAKMIGLGKEAETPPPRAGGKAKATPKAKVKVAAKGPSPKAVEKALKKATKGAPAATAGLAAAARGIVEGGPSVVADAAGTAEDLEELVDEVGDAVGGVAEKQAATAAAKKSLIEQAKGKIAGLTGGAADAAKGPTKKNALLELFATLKGKEGPLPVNAVGDLLGELGVDASKAGGIEASLADNLGDRGLVDLLGTSGSAEKIAAEAKPNVIQRLLGSATEGAKGLLGRTADPTKKAISEAVYGTGLRGGLKRAGKILTSGAVGLPLLIELLMRGPGVAAKFGIMSDEDQMRLDAANAPLPDVMDLRDQIEQEELLAARQARIAHTDPVGYEILTRMVAGERPSIPLTQHEQFIGGTGRQGAQFPNVQRKQAEDAIKALLE